MLTIFGKKKKDDSSVQIDTGKDAGQAPSQPPSMPPETIQPQAPIPTTTQNQPTTWPTQSAVVGQSIPPPPAPPMKQMTSGPMPRQLPLDFSFPSEETSLSRILQSLLQDIPTNTGSSFSSMRESTPEFVAPRATPPSRAMVIGQKDDEGGWEEQGKSSTSKQPPVIPSAPIIKADYMPGAQVPAGKTTTTSPVPQITIPPIPQRRDQPAEKPPDKPTKADKPTEKPAKEITPKKSARPPQNFDHIFELTQGNLESPGFVIINGPSGAGKTTLCSGLAANYLKKGDPCLYVTYDQAPTTLREQMKKLGS